eukprot:TRINITY_DN7149_c0_g1_i1.p1 TRINITY_DN7149_c0_g1~~TRINITY_DN7149_c0_g1_i1.p1  ORF type:complete len:430 (+),score=98.95 TRINITY_DN7149_c0_g1_i1:145-1434(+)
MKIKSGLFFLLSVLCVLAEKDKYIVLPLLGNFSEFYFYYTKIQVGTPKDTYTVIVDTGSSDLLIPSIGCDSCYGGNPLHYYNMSSSSTSKYIDCGDKEYHCSLPCPTSGECFFVEQYAGGITEQAIVVSDLITFPSSSKLSSSSPSSSSLSCQASFGRVYNVSMVNPSMEDNDDDGMEYRRPSHPLIHGFLGDEDYPEGIWGLAFQELSASGAEPLFSQFVDNKLLDDVFSICMNPVGGKLVLGGIGPFYSGQIQYVPMPHNTFYTFTILDFTAGGKSINVPSSSYDSRYTIVDSGTPLVTLPTIAYSALRELFVSNCSQNPLVGICTGIDNSTSTLFDSFCFSLTASEISMFPPLKFVIQGEDKNSVYLEYPPSAYLKEQYFCPPGQVGLGVTYDPKFSIIGAEMMQLYYTIFDRTNSRIGFAEVNNC